MTKRLTTKQQRFVDFYDGNATDAARKAGYKGNDATLAAVGLENPRKPYLVKAIQEREKKRNSQAIMDREERQKFWTKVARDEEIQKVAVGMGEEKKVVEIPPKLSDRLRASELLGKSEGDFIERRREEGELTVKIVRFCDETAKYPTPLKRSF